MLYRTIDGEQPKMRLILVFALCAFCLARAPHNLLALLLSTRMFSLRSFL